MQKQQVDLVRLFTVEEVRMAIKGLNRKGTCGPDGFMSFSSIILGFCRYRCHGHLGGV